MTGALRWAFAEHPDPIPSPRGGASVALGASGVPFGKSSDADCREFEARLGPGDWLDPYSDVLTDAKNEEHEDFGTDVPVESLARTRESSLSDTVRAVRRILDRCRCREELGDDPTRVGLEVIAPCTLVWPGAGEPDRNVPTTPIPQWQVPGIRERATARIRRSLAAERWYAELDRDEHSAPASPHVAAADSVLSGLVRQQSAGQSIAGGEGRMGVTSVRYNVGQERLEELLKSVDRPGDYCFHGRSAEPMPRLRVDGVGAISFPVPESQAQALVGVAEQAPYGRGTRTLVDTSVRKCWQIDSTHVHLGGLNWRTTLAKMVVRVAQGIGCPQERLSARLYKLLVYEEGGFFVEHRDSEKAVGMVGTLVVSLPAAGEGGELVVRHDGRETVVDLSVSYADELAYAAFYSDCRHETRPLTMGHRVSLVFNLILSGDRPPGAGRAPDYGGQVDAIEALLAGWSREADGSDKLVWLLDHGYSQAGLSFDALKGVDAAVADVLAEASGASDCCLHSAILHIRETGTPKYEYYGYDDGGPDADDEISEVDESECWLDSWKSENGSSPEFGKVPLLDGELLPVDALADAYPDEAELHEAMGNGGAMVEHAYLNAALVLWPRARTIKVLARGGIGGAVEYALAQIKRTTPGQATNQQLGLVHEILEAWPRTNVNYGRGPGRARAKMLQLLKSVGPRAQSHVERFLGECVLPQYSTQEDDALIDSATTIGPDLMGRFLPELIERHLKHYPRSLPNLVVRLRDRISSNADDAWSSALRESARTVHGSLREALDCTAHQSSRWRTGVQAEDFDSTSIAAILRVGWEFDLDAEAVASAGLLARRPTSATPDRAIPTALATLSTHAGKEGFWVLWRHAADFLLNRSATPPETPRDWHVRAEIKCRCEACRPFTSFCSDRSSRSRTFAIRQDLRYHLRNKIKRHRLPMDSRTVRTGRPYKLVCTKNRADFRTRIEEYARDVEQMESLIRSAPIGSSAVDAEERVRRLRTACALGG